MIYRVRHLYRFGCRDAHRVRQLNKPLASNACLDVESHAHLASLAGYKVKLLTRRTALRQVGVKFCGLNRRTCDIFRKLLYFVADCVEFFRRDLHIQYLADACHRVLEFDGLVDGAHDRSGKGEGCCARSGSNIGRTSRDDH